MNEHGEDSGRSGGAAVRVPPPLVYVVATVVGVLLQRFVLRLSWDVGVTLRTILAVAFGSIGLTMLIAAERSFLRIGQDPKPWTPTPGIVTSGVYGLSRNPMYVGLALIQLTLGVALANGWILVFVPLVLGVVYLVAVRHEEAYLEREFGQEYLDYRATVRRWL